MARSKALNIRSLAIKFLLGILLISPFNLFGDGLMLNVQLYFLVYSASILICIFTINSRFLGRCIPIVLTCICVSSLRMLAGEAMATRFNMYVFTYVSGVLTIGIPAIFDISIRHLIFPDLPLFYIQTEKLHESMHDAAREIFKLDYIYCFIPTMSCFLWAVFLVISGHRTLLIAPLKSSILLFVISSILFLIRLISIDKKGIIIPQARKSIYICIKNNRLLFLFCLISILTSYFISAISIDGMLVSACLSIIFIVYLVLYCTLPNSDITHEFVALQDSLRLSKKDFLAFLLLFLMFFALMAFFHST